MGAQGENFESILARSHCMKQPEGAQWASHTAKLPAALVPDDMELLQVQVMFRHGDKIDPTRYRGTFPSYPMENECRCFRLHPQPEDDAPAGQGKDGELTDQGHSRAH